MNETGQRRNGWVDLLGRPSEQQYAEREDKAPPQADIYTDSTPIEPESRKRGRGSFLRWLFFVIIIIYALLSYYHGPILTSLGRYLVVAHTPEKSDLIVCLAGENVERGLAVADAYQSELAPVIFITREEPPDGYEVLSQKGLNYPQSSDLLIEILMGLDVPRSALIIKESPVKSTVDEAKAVGDLAERKGYRSLILVTSPAHSRRAWLTFRKVFEKKDVRILMLPSRYSNFKPEDWWKHGKYAGMVTLEYAKLIYYALK